MLHFRFIKEQPMGKRHKSRPKITSNCTDNIRKFVQEIDIIIKVRILFEIRVRRGSFNVILNVILDFLDLYECKSETFNY